MFIQTVNVGLYLSFTFDSATDFFDHEQILPKSIFGFCYFFLTMCLHQFSYKGDFFFTLL